jgi:hypothetical protein
MNGRTSFGSSGRRQTALIDQPGGTIVRKPYEQLLIATLAGAIILSAAAFAVLPIGGI